MRLGISLRLPDLCADRWLVDSRMEGLRMEVGGCNSWMQLPGALVAWAEIGSGLVNIMGNFGISSFEGCGAGCDSFVKASQPQLVFRIEQMIDPKSLQCGWYLARAQGRPVSPVARAYARLTAAKPAPALTFTSL